MALPFEIPPSQFVREVAEGFDAENPSRILDVGCGEGRNSIYLAKMGHTVLGVTNNFTEAQAAIASASGQGLEACRFVVGDARQLPVRTSFDVVLTNETLHQMAPSHSQRVIRTMQQHTRQGGLNVISGYLIEETTQIPYRGRYFVPGELHGYYSSQSEWDVLSYAEDPYASQRVGDKTYVRSLAKIVAQRRWTKRSM